MSPMPQPRGGKIAPPSNLYTVILAVAFGVAAGHDRVRYVYACNTRTARFLACHSGISA